MKLAYLKFVILLLSANSCFGLSTTINSFNSGELSPLLDVRTDIAKYYSGCRTLENMLVYSYGGATRRPGTKYIASAKTASDKIRLISFEFALTQTYIVEVGDEYMRFYKDNGQILELYGVEDLSSLNNIVAHWLLNDNTASDVVLDDDGNTHDGIATVDVFNLNTAGKAGTGCFDLDGQYTVEMTDHDDFSFTDDSDDSAFSIVCWAYITPKGDIQTLLSKWQDSASTREWRLSLSSDRKLQLNLSDTTSDFSGNIVAQWKLNEAAANTTVLDATANNHDGTTQVDDTVDLSETGKISTCLNFGGADAVVITADADTLSFGDASNDSAFSIATWVYVEPSTTTQRILAKWDKTTGAELREWGLYIDSAEKLTFIIYDESANAYQLRYSHYALSTGWHFVVATYDGRGGAYAGLGIDLYVDGEDVVDFRLSAGTYTAMVNTDTKVVIGAHYGTGGTLDYYWKNKIDNVILFDNELTQSNVSTLYNSGSGTETLGAAEVSAVTDDAISIGWHYLVSTYSAPAAATAADGIILYVDGVAVDSTKTNDAAYIAMQNGAEEIRIGSQRNSGDSANENFWADKIDEISIFSDVLTPTEVASLYTELTYEISTPYDIDDVFELQTIQSADTMYIVHPEYSPRKLTRLAHNLWTLAEIDFERGPFLDENETETTITPSATTGTITLTASDSIWNANHVGALWQITHIVAAESAEGSFTGVDNSTTINVQFGRTFHFSTHGTWTGTMLLQRSYDSGVTWEDVRSVHYEGDGNITYSDEEIVEDAIYRVRMNAYTSGPARYSLTALSHKLNGVVEIATYTSATSVTATVEYTLGGTGATKYWSEGAWSVDEGYPSTVSFYEERLVFAATTNNPQTIWFSQTADWENFLIGNNDSDAMNYTIAANQVNAIRWLAPQDWLLIGTIGAEWKMGSGSIEEPLTPTKVTTKRQSSNGSANLQPIMVDNVILYVQRQNRKLFELVYSFEADSFVSPDLTVLSEHITGSGITQMAYQKTPDPILWCVTDDGDLATMTYKRSQNVVGWSKQLFDGDVESVAVIPGDDEDEVWVSVERTIGGSSVRYIEQFQPRDWGANQGDAFFVDSGLSFDGGEAVTITDITQASPAVVMATSHNFSDGEQVRIISVSGMTEVNDEVYTVDDATINTFSLEDATGSVDINSTGFTAYASGGSVEQVENTFTTLSHLEGETVSVAGDGGYAGSHTVAGGTITLDDYYNKAHAGLPYTSKLKPMRLELKQSQNLQGKTSRITELTVRFFETLGGEFGPDFDTLTSFIFRDIDDPVEAPPPLFTGEKKEFFEGDYSLDSAICLQQDLPLPFTVLAIIPEFEVQP